ncbi:hypothetical protein DFH06DRAFT_1422420 [Mycena polygramma]|nr:hypothetical protein DFH06DRAFT_1422420 [Mycena polygramma]
MSLVKSGTQQGYNEGEGNGSNQSQRTRAPYCERERESGTKVSNGGSEVEGGRTDVERRDTNRKCRLTLGTWLKLTLNWRGSVTLTLCHGLQLTFEGVGLTFTGVALTLKIVAPPKAPVKYRSSARTDKCDVKISLPRAQKEQVGEWNQRQVKTLRELTGGMDNLKLARTVRVRLQMRVGGGQIIGKWQASVNIPVDSGTSARQSKERKHAAFQRQTQRRNTLWSAAGDEEEELAKELTASRSSSLQSYPPSSLEAGTHLERVILSSSSSSALSFCHTELNFSIYSTASISRDGPGNPSNIAAHLQNGSST